MLWFFDLDNTLHNASHAIFPAITANMNAFVEKTLAANGDPSDPATVNAVRTEYWKRYGATLLGMVKHHDVCADDFLHASHQFDDLSMMIRAERGLNRLFLRLPGRKVLLTNAPRKYSRDIVLHLGLHRHFADHIPIEAMRVHGSLRPKPSRRMLRTLLAKKRVKPQQCILVEDTAQNLESRQIARHAYRAGHPSTCRSKPTNGNICFRSRNQSAGTAPLMSTSK